jgi:catechol 2,3-dioxygenase-like lactoylglutathione lyase family enzyme
MNKLDYAIVFVTDMKRATSFYRDILEIPVKCESPEWTELATEGCTLALHLDKDPDPAPSAQTAGRCQLGFRVPDIDKFHQKMLANQVRCVRPPKQEDFGGKLGLYADPDGLIISVVQF